MADDANATPPVETPALTPEEVRAARIEKAKRNLLPPCKPGETRNPKGINGRKRAAGLIRWLEEPSDADEQKTRAEVVWQKLYLATLKGSVQAGKVLLEQCGRPPPSSAEQALILAEHFRKVESDRFNFARELLGERIRSMKPAELAEFFSRMAPNVRAYLDMADAMKAERDGVPVQPQLSQPQPSEQVLETPCSTVAAEVAMGDVSASPPAEGTEVQPSAPNVSPTEAGITTTGEP